MQVILSTSIKISNNKKYAEDITPVLKHTHTHTSRSFLFPCLLCYNLYFHSLLCLDFHVLLFRINGLLPTVISANKYGNVARFLNHSCCPNLEVLKDPKLMREVVQGHGIYHVVFQAMRRIWPGEELVIDYHPEKSRTALVSSTENKIKCACGSGIYCKAWLPI